MPVVKLSSTNIATFLSFFAVPCYAVQTPCIMLCVSLLFEPSLHRLTLSLCSHSSPSIAHMLRYPFSIKSIALSVSHVCCHLHLLGHLVLCIELAPISPNFSSSSNSTSNPIRPFNLLHARPLPHLHSLLTKIYVLYSKKVTYSAVSKAVRIAS